MEIARTENAGMTCCKILLALLPIAIIAQPPITGDVTVEKIAGDSGFTEGPVWHSQGFLLFSDISGDTVYRWTRESGSQVYIRPSGNSNGLAEDLQGRLLLAQHGKRQVARQEPDATETPLATHYNGQRLNSPNDLAVRSDGSIYFLTDPSYGISGSQEELGFYGIYRVTGDPRAPELLADNLKRPNGLVFSPDESKLYVADTNDARVVVFDVEPGGKLADQRVFAQQPGSISPDGLEADSAGNLYIAGSQDRIWIYSPAGELIGEIAVPEKTRNLAWGDADGRGLYVTSGASVYHVRAKAGASLYPEMVRLPAGEFEMGDHHDFVDPGHPSDEVPIHQVALSAFHIGAYEVTNRQYAEFLNSAHSAGLIEVRDGMVYRIGTTDAYCETQLMVEYSSIGWDGTVFTIVDHRANHPAVGVRWFGAAAYTNWLSEQQGYEPCYDVTTWKCDFSKNGYRLPTEAEWEYAGRGGQHDPYRNYPWGDDPDNSKANWPSSGDPYEDGTLPLTTPAGFYNGELREVADYGWPGAQQTYQTSDGSNPYGLYDMAGNVWEWCNDWYLRDYYSVSPPTDPPGPDTASPMPDGVSYHVLRGGNWYNGPQGHSRVSNRDPAYYRGPQDPNHPWYHVGFRVARSSAPATAVSAASFSVDGVLAAASIVSVFGKDLAPEIAVAVTTPLPTVLAGTSVRVTDSQGTARLAPLFAVSPGQVNFFLPETTQPGDALVTVLSGGHEAGSGTAQVELIAPGLFTANASGEGVAAAVALRITADGTQTSGLVFDGTAPAGLRTSVPIDLGSDDDQVYLLLFGTGMRHFQHNATATIDGASIGVAGPVDQGQFLGLDQVNLGPLPHLLAGRGEVDIDLTVDGKIANKVTVSIQ